MDATIAIICLIALLAGAVVVIWVREADHKAARGYDGATIKFLREEIAKFDHDGDGKPGGSLRKVKG